MTTDWVSSAIRGTIPAIVVASLILFRRWFPAREYREHVDWNSDELWGHFRPLYWRFTGVLVLVMIVFLFGSWFVLSHTNRFISVIDGPSEIHLLPQTAIWWFFPGFGAIACSCEITFQIFGLFVGHDELELFNSWMNNTSRGWIRSRYQGIDSRRVLRWMMIGIALPIGLFVLLALPMHANIGPESIRDCGYAFRTCEVFPLSGVVRVTEISGFRDKSGRLIDRSGLVLDFRDGRRWSSAEWGDWQRFVDPKLRDFLLGTTGLQLGYATTEQDIPAEGR